MTLIINGYSEKNMQLIKELATQLGLEVKREKQITKQQAEIDVPKKLTQKEKNAFIKEHSKAVNKAAAKRLMELHGLDYDSFSR